MHSFNMRDGTIHDGVFVILAGTYVMWQLQETCPDYLYTLPMWVLGITLTTLLVCKQKPSVPLPYLIKLSPAASVCVYICMCVLPFTLMLLRSVIFISILGNIQGLLGLLLLT